MVCKYYSGSTWFYLLGMILTGSARSLVVKLAYQSGFRAPLTVTLLYLLGKSFSLVVYWFNQWLLAKYDYIAVFYVPKVYEGDDNDAIVRQIQSDMHHNDEHDHIDENHSLEMVTTECDGKKSDEEGVTEIEAVTSPAITEVEESVPSQFYSAVENFYTYALSSINDEQSNIPNGSNHGLTTESEEQIKHSVQTIPYYLRPLLPAVFNLLASALRWAALVYMDASVAEMLISGLELTLSVVAARIFRKRMVAKSRWFGVLVVACGLIIIERANNSTKEEEEEDRHGMQDVMTGVILIILQSILSALQDLAEEVFMQASDFPATMMLGIEGLYGFIIGLVIYASIGATKQLKIMEDIDATFSILHQKPMMRWWLVGLPFLFLITGLFNMKATQVTSAMTRNVWKTMRTVMVWMAALAIYYVGDNPVYGEAWHTPESFVIFFGFMIMSSGIFAYYRFA